MSNHTWTIVYEYQLEDLFKDHPNAVVIQLIDGDEYIVLVDESGNPVDKYLSLNLW